MDVCIVFQDDHLVAAIKPYGVLSEDGGGREGMPALLREQTGGEIYPVHRLDRTTEGLMVYAKTSAAAARLSRAIADGRMQKTYLAAVEGNPGSGGELCDLLFYDRARNKSFVVKRPRSGVKEAQLRFERLATADCGGRDISLVRVELMTGRTHQIRVQFASRQHPLIGDRRYGSAIQSRNIALCACGLTFSHPVTGEELCFRCEPTGEVFRLFKS